MVGSGAFGLISNLVSTAISTANMKYVSVAKQVHVEALKDLPKGYYSPLYLKDQEEPVEKNIY